MLADGRTVRIFGVKGDTGANGTFTVKRINADRFQLLVAPGSGNYVGGTGTWKIIPSAITAVTGPGVTPIVITLKGHGLENSDPVFIQGVTGNLAANGSFEVTKVDDDTFQLTRTAGNAVPTPNTGGFYRVNPIVDISAAAGEIRITTDRNHDLQNGSQVLIEGVEGNTAVNGTFTVKKVSSTIFSLNGTGGSERAGLCDGNGTLDLAEHRSHDGSWASHPDHGDGARTRER